VAAVIRGDFQVLTRAIEIGVSGGRHLASSRLYAPKPPVVELLDSGN
jgi:hypothetical protein